MMEYLGSIGEYVENGKTGFIFESGDITQLANYIIDLMENDKKCTEMGFKAKIKAMEYEENNVFPKNLDQYSTLIKAKAQRKN